jgi:hypothetical protein
VDLADERIDVDVDDQTLLAGPGAGGPRALKALRRAPGRAGGHA